MTTDQGPPPAGSLAEEAAKLLGVLQGLAGDAARDGAAGAARGTAERVLADLDEHLANGSASCTYCPICQLISLVRGTSPEVRQHLSVAAGSLLQAASGLLATRVPRASEEDRVEHIDVSGDDDGWPDEADQDHPERDRAEGEDDSWG